MRDARPTQPRVEKPRFYTGLGPRARWIAHAWGLAAIVSFLTFAVTVGLPRSLEGGLLNHTLEARAQYAFFALTSVGMLVAWLHPLAGGSIAAISAVGLGVLTGVQYRQIVALLVVLAFFIPAALEVILCMRGRPWRAYVAAGASMTALLVLGGVGAFQAHATTFGPSHPESHLSAQESELVEWVWSGAVSETSATVKAKVEHPDVAVRLALTPVSGGTPIRHLEPSGEGPGPGGVVSFVVTRLEPDTEYEYVVEVDGQQERARRGRFQTFPAGPTSFTVAVGACARVGSNGRVFGAIRAADPLLYLITGDFFYGDIDDNKPGLFREQFDKAFTRPAQAALYQNVPVAYVWDDHDYGPDNSDSTAPSREAARTVYRESVPHYALPAGDHDAAIYQAFTIGRVRFLLTDTRSERDLPTVDAPASPRSMLGAEQKAWLKEELLAANGAFPVIVWVNSVPWIAEATANGDNWSGFSEERTELADFVDDNDIEGVVMVSGDAHMLAVDDGSNSGYSTSGSAGFPVLQAAALDRRGSVKGGPYSEGAFPGSGQFGLVSVDDEGGDEVVVSLRGLNWEGEEIVSHSLRLPAN